MPGYNHYTFRDRSTGQWLFRTWAVRPLRAYQKFLDAFRIHLQWGPRGEIQFIDMDTHMSQFSCFAATFVDAVEAYFKDRNIEVEQI